MLCGSQGAIRSNQAIVEETNRISAYLEPPPEPACRTTDCVNHGQGIFSAPRLYDRHGTTAAGSPRWRCKGCGKTVTQSKVGRAHRRSNENLTVFRALVMGKSPIRGIARVADLSPKAVYDKIEFIWRQCVAFAADRERDLPRKDLARLWLSTDRQDYVLNWSNRADKRNTTLSAVGTADNLTGYVFGQHLNYDPAPVAAEIQALAEAAGDPQVSPPFRQFARLWTAQDYTEALESDPGPRVPRLLGRGVAQRIAEREEEVAAVPDSEALDRPSFARALPKSGMQVHIEYTAAAHYRLLHRLLSHAGKVRFFIDQDDTLWAGCIAAWSEEIRAGLADVFYVQIDKSLTVDDRKRLVKSGEAAYLAFLKARGVDWDKRRVASSLIVEQLRAMDPALPWRKRWVHHPIHTMYEPDKAVCYASDRHDLTPEHLAAIMVRASLHGIDRFFQQLRRMLSLLERPIGSASNMGRRWHGYSAYNPLMVQRLIDIYRVYYNFVKLSESAKKDGPPIRETPASKLGLARAPVRMEDILYF
jgi:transposase-like protein